MSLFNVTWKPTPASTTSLQTSSMNVVGLLMTEVVIAANVSSVSGKHRTVRYVKETTVLTEVTNPTTLEKSLIMVPLLCIILAHLILIQVGVFDNHQRTVRIVQ